MQLSHDITLQHSITTDSFNKKLHGKTIDIPNSTGKPWLEGLLNHQIPGIGLLITICIVSLTFTVVLGTRTL